MPMQVNGNVGINWGLITAPATPGLAAGGRLLNLVKNLTFQPGTGANQMDLAWGVKEKSIAGSGNDAHDLTALTADDGSAVSFARVRAMAVFNYGPNNLTAKAGSNPWITWLLATGDGVIVGVGGLLLIVNPTATAYTVTGTTGDILRILNNAAGTITYDLALGGASA